MLSTTTSLVAVIVALIPLVVNPARAEAATEAVARINFGPAAPDYDAFIPSSFSAPVRQYSGSAGIIAGTTDDVAYNTHVYNNGDFSYVTPADGSKTYNVKLGFAEVYLPSCRIRRRLFSASVNGDIVDEIDVFAAVGCNQAYDVMFKDVRPVNGMISISLKKGLVQSPMISNLEIFVASGDGVDTPVAVSSVNFGGDAMGVYQTADPALLDGTSSTYSRIVDIAGADGDLTYSSHLWTESTMSYRLQVPNGVLYDVKLGFAETYTRSCGVDRRVFSASVAEQVVNDIDVFKSVGCNAVYDLSFKDVNPVNGEIVVSVMKTSGQNAMISNVVVYKANNTVVTPPEPKWALVDTTGQPTKRHEACFVMVDGKGYLLGGRGSTKPVDVFDPLTRTWAQKAGAGVELHHMQCVAVGSRVFIVSAWVGGYPNERNHDNIYIYDTDMNRWSTKRGLPEPRRRGGASAVLRNGKIYVTHGNRGGHGSQATTLGWMDAYDIASDTWETNLPNAPHPRDHTGGAMVNGKLCVAGGRDGGVSDFFNSPVLPTDCYNFGTSEWETHANIPAGRAGSAYGLTCDGHMMIAGGEGSGKAFNNVDLFDGSSWTSAQPLQTGRHGSGLAVASCECGQILIASGAESQGGGREISSTEIYFPDSDTTTRCA